MQLCVPHTIVRRRGDDYLRVPFHDTDILATILADTSDTCAISLSYSRGKLNGKVARHADILATILARMSVSVSWNAALYRPQNVD